MTSREDHKRFTQTARLGLRGEAFVEALLSEYAVPNRIVAPRDLGLDYLCEWVAGDRPSGVLFGVQVKTRTTKSIHLSSCGTDRQLNQLEEFAVTKGAPRIDQRTTNYWRGLAIPTYLFLVVERQTSDRVFTCYYRRFTPELTEAPDQGGMAANFYRVSEGAKFLAFADEVRMQGGFARDLFIDTVRWLYHHGRLAYPDPAAFGLRQFSADSVFTDLLRDYRDQVLRVYRQTGAILDQIGYTKSGDHGNART